MTMPIIIDRRKNPGKKNLSNRQRFIERFKGSIKEAARKHIGERSISDSGEQEINIPSDGINEPQFGHTRGEGDWDYVLPGNKEYNPGDTIDKPKEGSGRGGQEGSTDGGGDDKFKFFLSYEEYLDMIFDDLELPDLVKASHKSILSKQYRHAGYTTIGVPSNLNIERTSIAGLSRRIALRTPKLRKIEELEALLEEEDSDKKAEIVEEIQRLKIRAKAISFLDNVDLRFNNFVPQFRPITQAVMICIMDVSGSMREKEKIISKKFFLLLHLFLKRQYENIDVVFIRHHHEAKEVDENTFFTETETGGTVVSTAYEVAIKTIKDRYPSSEWNIYLAQSSDGDNANEDIEKSKSLLSMIMPIIQYMFYIEISSMDPEMYNYRDKELWSIVTAVKLLFPNISLERIHEESTIVSVFRKFFARTSKT